MSVLETQFHLTENQTNLRQEIVGGFTTFLTMSYIIFVQPAMLQNAGMDYGAVMVATCISSAVAIFIMGLYANYPFALAPAMGHNVFFTYIVCGQLGVPWQTALGAVFISGCIFIVLGFFGVRKMVMDVIPQPLKFSIAVGIGVMIALLGFQWAGIVVDNPATLISIGTLTKPYVLISGLGFLIAMILTCFHIRGAILFGITASAIMAWQYGLIEYKGIVAPPPAITPTLLQIQPLEALKLSMISVIFIFFILDLFDTVGTLVGVGELGGFMQNGELPRARQALLSDAVGTVTGSLLGTSTITTYVESSSGISDGARTGLANMVTGCLFLLAIFFSPIVEMLGKGILTDSGAYVYPIIAPALIMVGYMMMRGVKHIQWDDPTDAIPSFLCILFIGFSFSITEGIAFGFISYTILKTVTARIHEIHPLMYIFSAIFIFRYFYLTF